MNPWQHTGLTQLAASAAHRPSPKIGVVDGPVDGGHPVLSGARIQGIDRSPPSCSNPSSPACRHGTFVAGLLGRSCPMSEVVVHPLFCEADDLGACPTVRPQHLADALGRLMDRGCRIINMSVGLEGGPVELLTSVRQAYRRAQAEGVLLVAAAGNSAGLDANPLFRDPWVICVAAQDRRGRILPSSNRGGQVARLGLLAPGDEVLGPAPGGREAPMSGTSAAAPLVTAAAALLWSLVPQATADDIRRALLRPHLERHPVIPPPLDAVDSLRWLSRHLAPTRSPMNHSPAPTLALHASPPPPSGAILPRSCSCAPGPTLGFVYSTGSVEPRFPDQGVRREFDAAAQAEGKRSDAFYEILSMDKYRYLARLMCWVLRSNEDPIGVLVPRSEAELTDLIDSLELSLQPSPEWVVTGALGGPAPPSKCDGLEVPMISLVELLYFTQAKLIEQLRSSVVLPSGATQTDLDQAIQQIWTATGVWREPGFDDAQRARNYVALRTTAIYERTVALALPGSGSLWLQSIESSVAQSPAGRRVANVDAKYQGSSGQAETLRVEVDVTDVFAFQSKALYSV